MADLRIENVPQVALGNSTEIKQKDATGFAEVVKGAITEFGRLEREADGSIVDLLKGKADITQTMIALEKADTSMRLVLVARNKVIQAYREIMNMQF